MSEIKQYTLAQDFTAPKINLAPREMEARQTFAKGTVINGEEYADEDNGLQLVIVDGQWAIPVTALEQEASPVETETKTMGEDFKKEFERIKSTNIVDTVIAKSRNSVNGMIVGGTIGLIYGAITKKSMLWSVILGGVAGGFIGNLWKVDVKSMQKASETKAV